MFGSVRGGNYGAVGQSINKQNQAINEINAESSPDYSQIANEAIKGRSRERRAAIEAEAAVQQTGLAQMANVKQTQIKVDTDKEIREIKKPARRMAGVVGAMGTIAGSAMLLKKDEEDTSYKDKYEADLQALEQQIEDLYNRPDPEADAPTFKPKPFEYDGDKGGFSSDGSTQQTGGSVSATSVEGIRGNVYNYLTQHHKLSKNHALGLMANIDRESGFNPKIMSGDDGGYGGLFQWKGGRQTKTVQDAVKAGDWKAQIDYALSEPENLSAVKPGAFQATSFGSAQEAADWWMTKWERPADLAGGSKKHSSFLSGYKF